MGILPAGAPSIVQHNNAYTTGEHQNMTKEQNVTNEDTSSPPAAGKVAPRYLNAKQRQAGYIKTKARLEKLRNSLG
jgi:hypothetical protein